VDHLPQPDEAEREVAAREAAIACAGSPRSVTTDGTGVARRDTAVGRSGRCDDADRRVVWGL